MTDLPQLQQALVGAARRRNRRARARSALVGLAALAAFTIAAAPAFDGPEREREVTAPPAHSSAPTAREAADRFAVLRDESRRVENFRGLDAGPGSLTYRWLRRGGYSYYASVGENICFDIHGAGGRSFGCLNSDDLDDFAEGRYAGIGALPLDGEIFISALVPDGTRDGRLTYRDGTTQPVPIRGNVLAVLVDEMPAKVSWATPNGERFASRL